MSNCVVCEKKTKRSFNKYCSNRCQAEDIHRRFVEAWKTGGVSVSKNISKHIKRYLSEKYQNKCQLCGWNKKNLITGKVPLEVDHINGNAFDNGEANLRLICPNCHSLSHNFRNLNKGKGRSWRK